MPSMYVSMTMELITCCECKVPFAVADWHQERLQKSGETFCCPNGHRQSYNNSEVKRLKAELDALKSENTRMKNAEKAREMAAKEAAEKAKLEQEAKKKAIKEEESGKVDPFEYQATPRAEYIWSKEEKDKLISLRQDNPSLPWSEIGKRLEKTGPQCSSMYHSMKSRGQIPYQKPKLDDAAWVDMQKMLVAGDTREAIAKKHGSTLEDVNSFIEQRLKAKNGAA